MIKQINTEQYIYDKLARIRLKSIRKHMHMTQNQIAELSGLSLSTIRHIESEDTSVSPRMESVIGYLNAMGYEMNFKLKDENVKQNMIVYIDDQV